MRPAFSTTRSAGALALLLLVLLALPVVVRNNWLPPREQSYAALGWGSGPYPWIQNQVFQEKSDIDILLIGSSHILHCLDARWVEGELSRKLGRPAVVRVIGWGGAGYEAPYFIIRDLLENRKVHLLVFYNESNIPKVKNDKSPEWFRFSDGKKTLHGLPLTEKAYFYFAALVGMPRNLLALLRSNLPAELHGAKPNFWEEHYASKNLADNLGSTASELGYDAKADVNHAVPFVPYAPKTTASPGDAVVYSESTKDKFQFSPEPLWPLQVHFAKLFISKARENGCRLVMLHIPTVKDSRTPKIEERAFWLENPDIFLLGVPPAKMFDGLTDDQVCNLFFNTEHLNKNGQAYFTSLIGPKLLELYDNQTGH